MLTDPIICESQYTRLFKDRARILNIAPLKSLNSAKPNHVHEKEYV